MPIQEGMVTGNVMNEPAEDDRLGKELESTLNRAMDAAKHHRIELERAERVARSCKAAMEQLNARELVAQEEDVAMLKSQLGEIQRGY